MLILVLKYLQVKIIIVSHYISYCHCILTKVSYIIANFRLLPTKCSFLYKRLIWFALFIVFWNSEFGWTPFELGLKTLNLFGALKFDELKINLFFTFSITPYLCAFNKTRGTYTILALIFTWIIFRITTAITFSFYGMLAMLIEFLKHIIVHCWLFLSKNRFFISSFLVTHLLSKNDINLCPNSSFLLLVTLILVFLFFL